MICRGVLENCLWGLELVTWFAVESLRHDAGQDPTLLSSVSQLKAPLLYLFRGEAREQK